MMKFVTSDNSSKASSSSLRHAEQYDNCSELLIESDATPLKELDPAILSCGLPAIVFGGGGCGAGELDRASAPTILRYTFAQLLAFRKIPLSHRRPVAIDDPRTGQYPIWQRNGFRARASGSDEELYHSGGSGAGRKPNDRHRDNGFNPPRFRRNHEFSNRNHHVIVKSYSAGDAHQVRLQDTVIEEEPEWVVAGPTSRLDTIELRGFDDDMTRTVTDTIKSLPTAAAAAAAAGPSRAQSFYDGLMHYEHVHPKHGSKHDTSGSGDGESVSNPSSSSPPARSTPTKHVTDLNNNSHAGARKGGKGTTAGSSGPSGSSSSSSAGVNVSNFEEFMKFDSILGDSGDADSSRFSKYFRRGGISGVPDPGQHHRQHHPVHGQHSTAPHVRFALERNTQHHYQRQPGSGRLSMASLQNLPGGMERSSLPYDSQAPGGHITDTEEGGSKSFQHLVDMIAAQNQRMQQQQQQQYLLQLLQNSQQTESLRQMLMKNSREVGVPAPAPKGRSQSGGGGAQHQGPGRVPTQRELQLHTQSIMKNALLRKKIVEQSRLILEQQEPIPAVQQLIRSICPNVQRSLAVLAAGSNSSSQQHQHQQHNNFPGDAGYGAPFGSGKRGQTRASGPNRRY